MFSAIVTKRILESFINIDIFWLKQKGYLSQTDFFRSGSVRWNDLLSIRAEIQFEVNLNLKVGSHVKFIYKLLNKREGEEEFIKYEVALSSTSCRFGGIRYWFICPLIGCGRRVAVLYYLGQYFGCRHCGNMAYASQMRGGRYRSTSLTYADIEKAEREVKRFYYRRKPTKKYQRLLKMNEKFDRSFLFVFAKQKQFNEIVRSRQLTQQKT